MLLISSCKDRNVNLLVFSKTAGFRHASIEDGVAALKKLAKENKIALEATEDASVFNEKNLKRFDAVIFLSTTGDVLDFHQEAAFERYIQAGGGYVGIHSASDTEYTWPWYGKMVGGYFKNHPKQQEAEINITDANHPSTSMLPGVWKRFDEWYNYKSLNPEVNVLMTLDESTYQGGENGDPHPIAWYHDYDGGRAFYTGLGHTSESFKEPLFLEHILGGIQYAIGEKKNLNYTLAKTKVIPPENRFRKVDLIHNLDEPMEADQFDDGKIILVERKGAIKLYNPTTDMIKEVTKMPVHTGEEDGLLGVAIDPNHLQNQWIYLFYSPKGNKSVQHVSRFVFADDSLHYQTEKVVLEIDLQREECCHSAGCLEFGPDGNLFISVGDNTNPFESNGFSPIDERKGRSPFDAQGSAANTNDLRGKILRIKPENDGTYSIPKGNLFPEGTPNTRPEIYVMGCRNPFRFSIDSKNKNLFWGDVGPDSGEDGEERGPKGLDEINLAKGPGFYGWPYFRGNGQTYFDFDFSSKKSKALFDLKNPINDSPNNTGLKELPPFQKSLIWYSYDESKEFPWMGTGGKNPMAGPVFYSDNFDGIENKFPDYFDGKLFIYEWMRNWIYIVKINEQGEFVKADPFIPNTSLSRPMDMFFGKDGSLYLLEYGAQWFARNMDARLSKIEYIKGNRSPIARIVADKTIGSVPLTVVFSADESEDFDQDDLEYEWTFTNTSPKNRSMFPTFTFTDPGVYKVQLKVTDPLGNSSVASQIIQVGNEPPKVAWNLDSNESFFWKNQKINYEVQVSDKEDGSTREGQIDTKKVMVSFDYLPQGHDITQIAQGHQAQASSSPLQAGAKLIEGSDCKACHAIDKKINGPSYLDISRRYVGDDFAARNLSRKIISGGSGVWGQTNMSAHPQLTNDEAMEMTLYILSLGVEQQQESAFPHKGIYIIDSKDEDEGSYVLLASYKDQGNRGIQSILTQEKIILQAPKLQAEKYHLGSSDLSKTQVENDKYISGIKNDSYFGYENIDLLGVAHINCSIRLPDYYKDEGSLEVRQGAIDGPIIGQMPFPMNGNKDFQEIQIPIQESKGKKNLYFICKNKNNPNATILEVDWIYFQNEDTL